LMWFLSKTGAEKVPPLLIIFVPPPPQSPSTRFRPTTHSRHNTRAAHDMHAHAHAQNATRYNLVGSSRFARPPLSSQKAKGSLPLKDITLKRGTKGYSFVLQPKVMHILRFVSCRVACRIYRACRVVCVSCACRVVCVPCMS
jgi:hypothetical protein